MIDKLSSKEVLEYLNKCNDREASVVTVWKVTEQKPYIITVGDIVDLVNRQQTEINIYKRNKKKIIFEIFESLKKLAYKDARIKESGGLETITIVNIDDINKCLQEFLKKWIQND